MGFIFGLLIGSTLSSGTPSGTVPNLGTIPFRCLAAFTQSDDAYRACRRASIANDLYRDSCDRDDRLAASGGCSIKQNIEWELAGLHELKQAIEKQQPQRGAP